MGTSVHKKCKTKRLKTLPTIKDLSDETKVAELVQLQLNIYFLQKFNQLLLRWLGVRACPILSRIIDEKKAL